MYNCICICICICICVYIYCYFFAVDLKFEWVSPEKCRSETRCKQEKHWALPIPVEAI